MLCRFVDMGSWAVRAVLSVGIFPYVQKLLGCTTNDLRPPLAFIWAKILTVDALCRLDLSANGASPPGIDYFVKMVQSGLNNTADNEGRALVPHEKFVAAFVLSAYIENNALV